ncbi:MAG: hypothetical protein K9N49_03025 [Candidatus Marinimicrobia bacterium]|nr:hypothetical protein [Candidatus Neomarinimicrobiota bacterium]
MREPVARRWALGALGALAVLAVVMGALSLGRGASAAWMISDAKQYYAWTRSVIVDGDLDFANDYELLYPPDPLPPEWHQRTPAGRTPNKYPFGVALLQAPAVWLAHVLARGGAGPADGEAPPYQWAAGLSLVAWALLGGYGFFAGAGRWKVTPGWALWGLLGMLGATPLAHYLTKEPGMAHGPGWATLGLLLWLSAPTENGGRWAGGRYLAIGALSGLLVLLRNTNVVLLPWVAGLLWARGGARPVRGWGWLALGFVGVVLWQPLVFHRLWGGWQWRTHSGEGFTGGAQGLWGTLFAVRHGALFFHPWYGLLLLLNALGLTHKTTRRPCALAWLAFGGLWLAHGLWWCWWLGRSFGNRAFIEALTPLTFGAALVLSVRPISRRSARLIWGLTALAILASAYLWLGYLARAYCDDGLHTARELWAWPLHGL